MWRLSGDERFKVGAWVCEKLHLDPGVYFTETDPDRQAARDAAATVIYDRERLRAIQEHNTI